MGLWPTFGGSAWMKRDPGFEVPPRACSRRAGTESGLPMWSPENSAGCKGMACRDLAGITGSLSLMLQCLACREATGPLVLAQRTHDKQHFSHLPRKYQGKLKREWICDFCLFQKDSVGRFMRKPFPNTLNLYGTLISKALHIC